MEVFSWTVSSPSLFDIVLFNTVFYFELIFISRLFGFCRWITDHDFNCQTSLVSSSLSAAQWDATFKYTHSNQNQKLQETTKKKILLELRWSTSKNKGILLERVINKQKARTKLKKIDREERGTVLLLYILWNSA